MDKTVVITGLGVFCPVGNDVNTVWANIVNGKSGIHKITSFDTSDFRSKIAGEVKEFELDVIFGRREARRMDRVTGLGLAATAQAVKDAELVITDENRNRIGVVIGTGIGGVSTMHDQMLIYAKHGPRRVNPFLVPRMLPDSTPGYIAIAHGVRGPNLAIVTACASGTNAIGESAELIKRGDADVVISGGAEAAIVPIAYAGMSIINALSTNNNDPTGASRPFDKNRDGFVMGEGSAILILESLEHALKRNAPIRAIVEGYGTSNDAYHISAPDENGIGASLSMQSAIHKAGLTYEDIDYINAHGTSTKLNDVSETKAIKIVFGNHAYQVPISSTKSMTGHLLGAAGALEAVLCVKAIETGIAPPTINYSTPDPECDLDYIPNQARTINPSHVLSNSFGFGGHNASIILGKADSLNTPTGSL